MLGYCLADIGFTTCPGGWVVEVDYTAMLSQLGLELGLSLAIISFNKIQLGSQCKDLLHCPREDLPHPTSPNM